MRHVVTALACLLLLAGCVATPKPFEHDAGDDEPFRPKQDKVEVAIATPANMPRQDGASASPPRWRSSCSPTTSSPPCSRRRAPLRIASAMSTRDAEFGTGIEIEIEWYLLGKGNGVEGPAISKTVVQAQRLCRGERQAGVAHRPAGGAAHRHADGQAAGLRGARAGPGRRRRQQADDPTNRRLCRPRRRPARTAPAGRTQAAARHAAPDQGDGRRRSRARRRTAIASCSAACAARWARARSW